MLIPQLFRFKVTSKDRVLAEITDLGLCADKLLHYIDYPHVHTAITNDRHNKFKKRFNMRLSRLLSLIIDTSSADQHLNAFRLLLLNTRFFVKCTNTQFLIDITAPEKVLKPVAEPVGGDCVVRKCCGQTSRERKNYDAYPTEEDQFVFKIDKKYFGFSNSEELLQFLIFCIDKTTPDQLVVSECPSQSTSAYLTCGSMNCTPRRSETTTVFLLDLILPHDDTTVTLRSDSTKLLHWLTHTHMTPTQMTDYLRSPDLLLAEAVGFYPAFQRALEKRIVEFIAIRSKQADFDWYVIQCFRLECEKPTILPKTRVKSVKRCGACGISEFCSLCHDQYHGGPCGLTGDEASEALIAETSKPCPRCTRSITKIDGCNHITCKCGAHFCWLCGMGYAPNEINAHYTTDRNFPDPFGGQCIGLQARQRTILPQALPEFDDRVDAMVDAFMQAPPARPAHPAQPARQVADFDAFMGAPLPLDQPELDVQPIPLDQLFQIDGNADRIAILEALAQLDDEDEWW
jgi:hypothetical protein